MKNLLKQKWILSLICLVFIGLSLLYFQKKIILVNGSDDVIFLEQAQHQAYGDFIAERYMTWSSRVGAESMIYFLVTKNLIIWKVLNVLMIFLLAYAINRIFLKKVHLIDFIFVLLTLGLVGNRILTSSTFCFHGSFNYIWPAATGILALVPLADFYFRSEIIKKAYLHGLYAMALIYTVLSNEQMGLILFGFYGIYVGYAYVKKIKLPKEIYLLLALTASLLLIVFLAPGNSIRYHAEIQRWYPDFNIISFGTYMERNIVWFFDKFFNQQKWLIILLGGMTYLAYYKKFSRRNYVFEFLLALPIGLMVIADTKKFNGFLFDFKKNITLSSALIYAYWSLYLVTLTSLLVKIDKRKYLNILLLVAGIASMLVLWASPSIFASANRVLLVCSVFLVIIINKLRLDSEIKVDRYLLIYSIFPIIHMLTIFYNWKKKFIIHY